MSKALKPIINPCSCIVLPVGSTPTSGFTFRQVLMAAGLCNSAGVLDANIEAIRFVGLEARAIRSTDASQSFVQFIGGATYQLSDPDRYAKLKVSDRNPLGFWRESIDGDGTPLVRSVNVDVGSVTIAVRYKNVAFQ